MHWLNTRLDLYFKLTYSNAFMGVRGNICHIPLETADCWHPYGLGASVFIPMKKERKNKNKQTHQIPKPIQT